MQEHSARHKTWDALAQFNERAKRRGINGREAVGDEGEPRGGGVALRRALAGIHGPRKGEPGVLLGARGAVLFHHAPEPEALLAGALAEQHQRALPKNRGQLHAARHRAPRLVGLGLRRRQGRRQRPPHRLSCPPLRRPRCKEAAQFVHSLCSCSLRTGVF